MTLTKRHNAYYTTNNYMTEKDHKQRQCKICERNIDHLNKRHSYCSDMCREEGRKIAYTKNNNKRSGMEPSEDTIQCLVCDKYYRQVGSHITQKHNMTAREYREIYGLEVKRGLTKGSYRELKAEQARESGVIEPNLLEAGKATRFKKGQEGIGVYDRAEATLEKIRRAARIANENRRRRASR